jgi:hypothetical protein
MTQVGQDRQAQTKWICLHSRQKNSLFSFYSCPSVCSYIFWLSCYAAVRLLLLPPVLHPPLSAVLACSPLLPRIYLHTPPRVVPKQHISYNTDITKVACCDYHTYVMYEWCNNCVTVVPRWCTRGVIVATNLFAYASEGGTCMQKVNENKTKQNFSC